MSPLLSGKVMYFHVPSAATGTAMRGNNDSALIVFTSGSGGGQGQTKVEEYLSEVFDNLSRITTGDNLGFGRGKGSGALDPSLCEDSGTSGRDDASYGSWDAKRK
jgi:hypothetical protein